MLLRVKGKSNGSRGVFLLNVFQPEVNSGGGRNSVSPSHQHREPGPELSSSQSGRLVKRDWTLGLLVPARFVCRRGSRSAQCPQKLPLAERTAGRCWAYEPESLKRRVGARGVVLAEGDKEDQAVAGAPPAAWGSLATMDVPLQQRPVAPGSPGKKRSDTSQRKGFCFQ